MSSAAGQSPPDTRVESRRFELGPLVVEVPTAYGPRVLDLGLGDGPQLFALLDDEMGVDGHPAGRYRFGGGHRLWAAPEVPGVTYAPDDSPCQVIAGAGQVTVTGGVDAAGLVKEMTLRWSPEGLLVDHRLINHGTVPLDLAPWAITQVRLGGIVVIPTGGPRSDGLQADRSLVLWPYTDLSDRRLSWERQALVIDASPGPPLKVGWGPGPARLGYWIDGHLFIKSFATAQGGEYVDRQAVAQVYLNESFSEIESLGPITRLSPGETASHREVWEVVLCQRTEDAIRQVVEGPAY